MSDDASPSHLAIVFAQVVTDLPGSGYSVIKGFMTKAESDQLAEEAMQFHADGFYKQAGVSRGNKNQNFAALHSIDATGVASKIRSGIRPDIRTDETMWFDESGLKPAQRLLWERLDRLKSALNESLFLGLWELEGHFALYREGGFYARHIDRFRSDDSRIISIVLYLNQNWRLGDGGELKIYAPDAALGTAGTAEPDAASAAPAPELQLPQLVVEPRAGTLVCFLSDKIPHEVARANVPRLSFAGWFRRRAVST